MAPTTMDTITEKCVCGGNLTVQAQYISDVKHVLEKFHERHKDCIKVWIGIGSIQLEDPPDESQ